MSDHAIFKTNYFYCESVEFASSVELKTFIPLYDAENLAKYLKKFAKKHEEEHIERTYIVRDIQTKAMAGWFSLQTSTLPYQEKESNFHIPAVELTNFAVDARYKKNHKNEFKELTIGEYIFRLIIEPIAYSVAKLAGCRDIYVFSLNKKKLIDYYQNCLGFKKLDEVDDFIQLQTSDYSKGLAFLYKPLEAKIVDYPQIKLIEEAH